MKVLLVIGDRSVEKLLEIALERYSKVVVEKCANNDQAVEVIRKDKFDLVLVEIPLEPTTKTFELIRRLGHSNVWVFASSITVSVANEATINGAKKSLITADLFGELFRENILSLSQ